MDCKFRILTKNQKTFDELKKYADGISQKGLIIIEAKCEFLDVLKKFDIEVLITPFRVGEVDCFYFDGEMKECDKKIFQKFDISKYEPIIWKKIEDEDLPF